MKKNSERFIVKEVFVGKMKPIGEGTYSRNFCKRKDKPTQKVYIDKHENHNPFMY